MTANEDLHDKLATTRRHHILDAAIKIFAEKGFNRATIKDIAKEAKIADGTIYKYFDNKTALWLAILNRFNESDQRETDFANSENTTMETFFRAYTQQRFDVFDEDAIRMFQIVISEVLVNAELRELYFNQIIAPTLAIGDKQFASWLTDKKIQTTDSQLLVRSMTGLVLGMMLLRMMGDKVTADRWQDMPNFIVDSLFVNILKGTTDERD